MDWTNVFENAWGIALGILFLMAILGALIMLFEIMEDNPLFKVVFYVGLFLLSFILIHFS